MHRPIMLAFYKARLTYSRAQYIWMLLMMVVFFSCKKEEHTTINSIDELEYDVIYEVPMNNAQNSQQEFNQLSDNPIIDKNGNVVILGQTFLNSDSRQVLARANHTNAQNCFHPFNPAETPRSVFYDEETDQAFVEVLDAIGGNYLVNFNSGYCTINWTTDIAEELKVFFPLQPQNFIMTLERMNDKIYAFGFMLDDQNVYNTWVLELNEAGEVSRSFIIPKMAVMTAKSNQFGSFDVYGESNIHSNWLKASLDEDFKVINDAYVETDMPRRGFSFVYPSNASYFYMFFSGSGTSFERFSLEGKLLNTVEVQNIPARISSGLLGLGSNGDVVLVGLDNLDSQVLNFVRIDFQGNVIVTKFVDGLRNNIANILGISETIDGDVIALILYQNGDSPSQTSTQIGLIKTRLE